MEKEYIYCNIKLTEDSNTYYYITNNKSFKTGDFVVVPTKGGRIDRIGRIEEIQNYSEEKVPFPIEQTKSIIRKALPIEVLEAGWGKKEIYTSSNNPMSSTLEKNNLESQNVKSIQEKKPKPVKSSPKRFSKNRNKSKKRGFLGKLVKGVGTVFFGILAGMRAAAKTKPKTPHQKYTGYQKGISYHFKDLS